MEAVSYTYQQEGRLVQVGASEPIVSWRGSGMRGCDIVALLRYEASFKLLAYIRPRVLMWKGTVEAASIFIAVVCAPRMDD